MEKLNLIGLLKDKHYEYKKKPCEHTFELIGATAIYEDDDLERPICRNLTYMCTKCGEVKKVVIGEI